MSEAETNVMTGWIHPTTVTFEGSSWTSSKASRNAPAAASSPNSSRPPGKLTSPRCVRNAVERRVKTRRASLASSKSTASTAEFGRCTSRTVDSPSIDRGLENPVRAAARRAPSRADRRPRGPPAPAGPLCPHAGLSLGQPTVRRDRDARTAGVGSPAGGLGAPSISRYLRTCRLSPSKHRDGS